MNESKEELDTGSGKEEGRIQPKGETRRDEYGSIRHEGFEKGIARVCKDQTAGAIGKDAFQTSQEKMKAAAIVVGFNHWYGNSAGDKTFTRDFIFQLKDKNPGLKILLVDNASSMAYPDDVVETLRLDRRVGYGIALNAGLRHLQGDDYDWYITFNNDCTIERGGDVLAVLKELSPEKLYGSGVNYDKRRKIAFQWSAWLAISRNVLERVGYFDEGLEAAFEDFDYELRAMDEGIELDTASFPVLHLDEHTRFEDSDYKYRWEKARNYFCIKHNMEMDRWFKI